MSNKNKKWDMRFLELANLISSWSLDPSTKVGAVIVDEDRRIVSVGYNGFPKNVVDSPERLNDRDVKYKMIVHAERNAMLFANRSLKGCTLYTTPFMPCATCAAMIIQTGIKRIVSYSSDNPRWIDEFNLSREMFNEAKIKIKLYEANYENTLQD